MPFARSRQPAYYYVVFWGLLLLAFTKVYISVATDRINRWNFYNADNLTTPAIYNDLIQGNALRGWDFEASRSFFPDIVLYVGLHALLGNVHLALMAYGAVQNLLLMFSWLALGRALFGPRPHLQTLIVASGALYVFFLSTGNCPAFVAMLLPDTHSGVMLMGICSILIMIRMLDPVARNNRGRIGLYASLLFLIAALTMWSDMIYMIQFFLPIMAAMFLAFVCSAVSAHQVFWVYLPLTFALPVSEVLVQLLPEFKTPTGAMAGVTQTTVWHQALEAIRTILNWNQITAWDIRYHRLFQSVWIAFILASLIMAIGMALALLRQRRTRPSFLVLLLFAVHLGAIVGGLLFMMQTRHSWGLALGLVPLLIEVVIFSRQPHPPSEEERSADAKVFLIVIFFLSSIAATLAGALLTGSTMPRYFLPTLLIPLFFGWPFLIGGYPAASRLCARQPVLYGLAVLILLFGEIHTIPGQFRKLRRLSDYYPEFIECLDQQTALRNIHFGLAEYWDAKDISVLSKNQLHAAQVRPSQRGLLAFEHFASNVNWYNHAFEFVITRETRNDSRSLLAEQVIRQFGPPADTFACLQNGGWRNVLVYNRAEDVEFQQQFTWFFYADYPAAELPSQTGKITGTRRIAEAPADAPGFLTYGPYHRVLAGRYAIEIQYSAQTADDRTPAGTWDLLNWETADHFDLIQQGNLPAGNAQRIICEFTVRRAGKLEVRTNYAGHGTLQVDRILLRRMP